MKKHEIILIFGTLISLMLVVTFNIAGKNQPELVPYGQEISDIIINLSLSYIAGCIIYWISVYIPESSKRRHANKIIYPMLKRIVSTMDTSIHNNILCPNPLARPMPNVRDLSTEELMKYLLAPVANTEIQGARICLDKYAINPITYIDEMIVITTLAIQDLLKNIRPYYNILDNDILEILTDIDNSMYFTFTGDSLKYRKRFVFDKEIFIQFYLLIRKLDNHITKF